MVSVVTWSKHVSCNFNLQGHVSSRDERSTCAEPFGYITLIIIQFLHRWHRSSSLTRTEVLNFVDRLHYQSSKLQSQWFLFASCTSPGNLVFSVEKRGVTNAKLSYYIDLQRWDLTRWLLGLEVTVTHDHASCWEIDLTTVSVGVESTVYQVDLVVSGRPIVYSA